MDTSSDTTRLRPVRWGAKGWSPAGGPSGVGAGPSSLRIVTLNTWFDLQDRPARLAAQLATFEALAPDVIALQEVTADLVRLLARSPWVQAHYALPEAVGPLLGDHGYGVLLLVRPAVAGFHYTPLPSEMGRGVLVADLGGGVAVGTVHLESMPEGAPRRVPQLRLCQRALAGARTAVLVGDFNFCHSYPEEAAIAPPWTDVWPLRHGDDPGWTCDSVNNTMRARPGKPSKQRRYDRVILRDDGHAWRVGDVARVGVAPIAPGVWMSDHFGLVADFRREGH
jgi:tyrosyl-DNA phosphodiesterase 2